MWYNDVGDNMYSIRQVALHLYFLSFLGFLGIVKILMDYRVLIRYSEITGEEVSAGYLQPIWFVVVPTVLFFVAGTIMLLLKTKSNK